MSEAHEPIATPAPNPPAGRLSPKDFEHLFAQSHSSLWLLAAGLVRVRGDADDVVQEAALQAVRRLPEFAPGTNFRAWMSQFVRYVAANHNRARQRDHARRAGDESAVNQAVSPDTTSRIDSPARPVIDRHGGLITEQGAFDDRVTMALRELQPVARACLLLRVVGGHSFKEVAALLDLPEGTAMSHVFRARAALQRALSPSSAKAPDASRPTPQEPR